MKKLILAVTVALLGIALFASDFAAGDTVYVADETAKVKSSSGWFAKTLSEVSYGDKLTVVKDGAKKTQVRTSSNVTGWVSTGSLTKKKIVKSEGGLAVSAAIDEMALAAKGIQQSAQDSAGQLGSEAEAALSEIGDKIAETKDKIAQEIINDPK